MNRIDLFFVVVAIWAAAISVIVYIDKTSQDGIYLGDYNECIKRESKNGR